MMPDFWYLDHSFFWIFPLIIPLVVADIILRAVSLWKAAKNNQLYWFIALAIVNSAGILPLTYLLFFQKKRKK